MYVLKDRKCERCGNEIEVLMYKDNKGTFIVDNGECVFCGKVEILPQEPYIPFVHEFCIKK